MCVINMLLLIRMLIVMKMLLCMELIEMAHGNFDAILV
jgi:hypothetical protein